MKKVVSRPEHKTNTREDESALARSTQPDRRLSATTKMLSQSEFDALWQEARQEGAPIEAFLEYKKARAQRLLELAMLQLHKTTEAKQQSPSSHSLDDSTTDLTRICWTQLLRELEPGDAQPLQLAKPLNNDDSPEP